MARKSRMSILKRQRELKNAEKAARKRAIRHGQPLPGITEPRPTLLTPEPQQAVDDPDAGPEAEQDAKDETQTTS